MPEIIENCIECGTELTEMAVWDHTPDGDALCSSSCYDDWMHNNAVCEQCGEAVGSDSLRYNENLGYAACDFCNEAHCDCEYCMNGGEDENEGCGPEESTDDPTAIELPALTVPALADRPARLMSAEIEVGRGGTYLAEKFHSEGLSEQGHMAGYHSSSGHTAAIHVEEDGSVAAEVVFQKFRLDRRGDASKFAAGIGVIKDAIGGEFVKLDMRCGLHIHIGLSYDAGSNSPCYGMDSVASLHHLWNHLEDTIFRLSSANWKGHRSEFGNDYSPKNQKGLTTRREIGRAHNSGRGALNLSNYLSARGYCRCGAFDFGEWSECQCEMEKATVEFRVFNTSANTRKLRAYAALCQALVAYAERNVVTADTHPALDWGSEYGGPAPAPDTDASIKRLKFIFNELPLTNDEKQDLLYCAEKSSLSEIMDRNLIRVDWATDRQPANSERTAAHA